MEQEVSRWEEIGFINSESELLFILHIGEAATHVKQAGMSHISCHGFVCIEFTSNLRLVRAFFFKDKTTGKIMILLFQSSNPEIGR